MKKKIAVFTNGWNDEYLDFVLEGIKNAASQYHIDVFVFLDYTSYDKSNENLVGELNILNLPDLTEFDGVLLLGNTLYVSGEIDILREKILEVGIPAVCLEALIDDIDCIRTENSILLPSMVLRISSGLVVRAIMLRVTTDIMP